MLDILFKNRKKINYIFAIFFFLFFIMCTRVSSEILSNDVPLLYGYDEEHYLDGEYDDTDNGYYSIFSYGIPSLLGLSMLLPFICQFIILDYSNIRHIYLSILCAMWVCISNVLIIFDYAMYFDSGMQISSSYIVPYLSNIVDIVQKTVSLSIIYMILILILGSIYGNRKPNNI